MIQTILFDADGVLITGQKFADHLQNDLHITQEMTAPFFKGPFRKCLIGQADLKEEIAPFLSEWGWEKSVDSFLDLWFKVEHHTNKELLEYIGELRKRGIKCFVATNQEKYRSQYMKEFMALDPLFDGMFASNEIGACKPEASFYQYILNTLEVMPESVLLWDDTAKNVDAAIKLGLSADLYTAFDDCKTKTERYLK